MGGWDLSKVRSYHSDRGRGAADRRRREGRTMRVQESSGLGLSWHEPPEARRVRDLAWLGLAWGKHYIPTSQQRREDSFVFKLRFRESSRYDSN